MGATPMDTTLMTASSTTYAPGDSVTVTLSGLSSGAFVHTSAGTTATISGFTAKMCTGTSLQYKASSVSSTETLTWTAPSDLTGVELDFADDGVATVTLSRPEKLNVVDVATRDELIDAFCAVRDAPHARVLLLRAEGRHFSAGAETKELLGRINHEVVALDVELT